MGKNDKRHALVPRLRFPEFCNSEGWKSLQLSELYDFKRTNTLSRDKLNYETGTIRNIHYGDIHTKFRALFRTEDEHVPYINPDLPVDSFDDDDYCEEGDIVLADASEDLNDVGKAIEIISLGRQPLVAGTHTILATRRGREPIVGFGGYLFQCDAVRTEVQKEAQGAKVYGISPKRISAISLPVPPTIAEQEKIADCLGSLDDLIEAEGRMLAALRDYKKGLMRQLFPREGETRPRLRFPEFLEAPDWNDAIVGDCVKTITPPRRLRTSEYLEQGDYPIVDQSPEPTCGYTNDAEAVVSDDLPVVIFGDHTCVVKFVDYPFAQGADGIKILKSKSGIADIFLFYSLQARPLVSNQYKRHYSSLRNQPLTFPPQESGEQNQIADCFTYLDAIIAAQAEKFEALRTHKRGLMQRLFPSSEDNE